MSRQKVSMTLTQIISGSKNQFMSCLGKNTCMGLGRVGVLINGNSSVHFRLKKNIYIYAFVTLNRVNNYTKAEYSTE